MAHLTPRWFKWWLLEQEQPPSGLASVSRQNSREEKDTLRKPSEASTNIPTVAQGKRAVSANPCSLATFNPESNASSASGEAMISQKEKTHLCLSHVT